MLLLGGDVGALGVARSLGRRGIAVRFLAGPNRIASFGRHAKTITRWPGADADGPLAWLEDYAYAGGVKGWVLVPAGDSEVRLLTDNHARLSESYRLSMPPWEVTRFAGDKSLTYGRAEELRLGHPHTYRLADRAAAEQADLMFPLILKPAMKEGVNALTLAKAWRADDRIQFLALFDEALGLAGAGGLIVQELIPDDGTNQFSYAAFCDNGALHLVMTARRTRQRPRKAGTGTFVEMLGPQGLKADAEAFLGSLSYTGLVEIEFMLDPRDGRFKLIDVNPRMWTWIALGPAAGVDFALAVWQHANGLSVTAGRAAAGHSWLYVPRDLPGALTEIWDGRLTLPAYLRQLFTALCNATLALDDPLPMLADLPLGLLRTLKR